MANLSDIVNVQISLATAGVTYGDFGTQLIAAPHVAFTDRVRTYSSYAEATEENFQQTLLDAIADCFAQEPHPRTIKIGRRSVSAVAIEPTSVASLTVYSLKIGGTLCTYTSDASGTVSEIATGIAAAITTAAIAGVTAANVSNDVVITYSGDAVPLTEFVKLQYVSITPIAGTTVTDDLDAILLADPEWYVLHTLSRTEASQQKAADWTEANERLYVLASGDPDILDSADTDDIISMLADTNYFRTAACYSELANTQYPDVAWAARVLPIQPGGETWALKRLASVEADSLSSTEQQTIFNKGGNTFEPYQPQLALTNPGKVVAGEWIDVIRFRDWLKNYIQVNLVTMMVNRDKVPYTDAGFQLVGNNIKASLREGQRVGGISPDELDADGKTVPGFIVTIPLRSEISDATAATRVLDISFVARLAGAIHVVEVTGTLAYSFN